MTLKESLTTCILAKYATFSGHASRSEYWWFTMVYVVILWGLPMLGFVLDSLVQSPIYSLMAIWLLSVLGLLVPMLAVSVRRLHDGGYSGYYVLLLFLPYIGGLILLYFMIQPTKKSIMPSQLTNIETQETHLTPPCETTQLTDHSKYMPKGEDY